MITYGQAVGLESAFADTVARFSQVNNRFNRDPEVKFDLERIEATIAEELLSGKPILLAEEEDLIPPTYLFSFGSLEKHAQTIYQKLPNQAELDPDQRTLLKQMAISNSEMLFSSIGRGI